MHIKIKELITKKVTPSDHDYNRHIFDEARICLSDALAKVCTLLEDLDTFSVSNYPEIYVSRLEELERLFEDVDTAAELVAGFLEVNDAIKKKRMKFTRKRSSLMPEGVMPTTSENVLLS